MPVPDVPPPTDVLSLVFLSWLAGTAALGAWTRLWGSAQRDPDLRPSGGEIQPGHFKVVWLVVAGIGLAAGFGYPPAWGVAALALLTFFAIYRQRDLQAGVVTGLIALVVLAIGAPAFAFAQAALLGAVTNAMLLGHWHLNQPKLGTKPIARLVYTLWAGIAAYAAWAVYLVVDGSAQGIRGLALITGIVFAVFAAILTAMVQHLVRTRSIMSATGILYLEILLAFVSVFTGSLAVLVVT